MGTIYAFGYATKKGLTIPKFTFEAEHFGDTMSP